jgi:hypothetical protein
VKVEMRTAFKMGRQAERSRGGRQGARAEAAAA